MTSSSIQANFDASIETVWDAVTAFDRVTWRSDLSKAEILDETRFLETTKDGFVTNFTVTLRKPLERLEFDMENNNLSGHWTGVFKKTETGTTVVFTETVNAKKFFLKPFVKLFLKKQQNAYISDLQNHLRADRDSF